MNIRTEEPRSLRQALLFAGVASGTIVGILGSSIVPLLIGTMVDGFGLSEFQAGIVGVIEIGAAPVVALLLAPFCTKLPLRAVALAGMSISVIAQFLCVSAGGFIELLMLRSVAGAGLGGAFVAANAIAASTANPNRVYGLGLAAALILIGLLTTLLGMVAQTYGFRSTYAVLGTFVLIMMPAVCFLRVDNLARQDISSSSALYDRRAAAVLVICVVLFNLGTGPIYAFIERIGNRMGMPVDTIALYLGMATFAGAVGALIPVWLPRNVVSSSRSVVIAFFLCAMACLMIGYAWSGAIYVSAAALYWVSYCFLYVALLAAGASIDPSGRVSAVIGGLNVLTYSLGPAIGGIISEHNSYRTLAWVCFGCCIVGAAVFRARFGSAVPARIVA